MKRMQNSAFIFFIQNYSTKLVTISYGFDWKNSLLNASLLWWSRCLVKIFKQKPLHCRYIHQNHFDALLIQTLQELFVSKFFDGFFNFTKINALHFCVKFTNAFYALFRLSRVCLPYTSVEPVVKGRPVRTQVTVRKRVDIINLSQNKTW